MLDKFHFAGALWTKSWRKHLKVVNVKSSFLNRKVLVSSGDDFEIWRTYETEYIKQHKHYNASFTDPMWCHQFY